MVEVINLEREWELIQVNVIVMICFNFNKICVYIDWIGFNLEEVVQVVEFMEVSKRFILYKRVVDFQK